VCTGLFGRKVGGHLSIRHYQLTYRRADFERYFKFAFVRNPWDRLASAYFFLRKGGLNERDRLWSEANLSRFASFDEFVRRWVTPKNVRSHFHFRPQFEFVEGAPGVPAVDFIGRFERLREDYDQLREKLGFGAELPRLNAESRDWRTADVYTAESARVVAEVFENDIRLFDYGGEGPLRSAASGAG
jgi:hypothetical protein